MYPLPLTNNDFLTAVTDSFKEFIRVGTSRSTAKLKYIHGAIAADIAYRLGPGYHVKAQGHGDGREGNIHGRYAEKKVDIAIYHDMDAVAGIAVKFVMQNYAQNSNNYFENMLGETANIRCNGIPYFQIFIVLDQMPYYYKSGQIKHWETFTSHNTAKYIKLSNDDTRRFLHTPNKTLIYVVHAPDCAAAQCKNDYLTFYRNAGNYTLSISQNMYGPFGDTILLNDYDTFIKKVYHTIMAR